MTDRVTEVLTALIGSLETKAKNSCPIATKDVAVNLKNRKKAIDVAEYGPLNPKEPNDKYWKKLADIWDVSESEAKKQRCGNCAAFIQTSKMNKCIEDGLAAGDTKENAWDTMDAGDLGYCEAFDFKCASSRTCSAWIVGGPITDKVEKEREEKARRVRTPEGSDRFNKPIGALITGSDIPVPNIVNAGDILQAVAKPVTAKPKKPAAKKPAPKKKVTRKKSPASFNIPNFKIVRTRLSSGNFYIYKGEDKKRKRVVTLSLSNPSGDWELKIEEPDGEGGIRKTVTKNDNYMSRKDTKSASILVERELKTPYIEELYAEYVDSKPSHDNFSDAFEGIYGIEWSYDDEDLIDETDIDQRWMAIEKESTELGIEIKRSTPNSKFDVHYEAQETINSVARIMDTMFPGFNAYQPIYALDPNTPNRALAYNIHSGPLNEFLRNPSPFMRAKKKDMVYADPTIDWDYSAIGLSNPVFGEDFDADKLGRFYIQDPKWWSVKNSEVVEKYNLEKWEGIFFGVLFHETGHTVARIAQGQMKGKSDKNKDTRTKFMTGFDEILKKFGFISSEDDLNMATTLVWDKKWNEKWLSTYSAESLHEFLAEVWAEWIFSPSPRPLATEVGNLLAEVLDDFLQNEYENEE
jgi:hypothetical protein